jgi:hypothetical protein
MTSPCCGFSLAVSGMMMPPDVFCLGVNTLDRNAVVKGAEFHCGVLLRLQTRSLGGEQRKRRSRPLSITFVVSLIGYVYTHFRFDFCVPGYDWKQKLRTAHWTKFYQKFYDYTLNHHVIPTP